MQGKIRSGELAAFEGMVSAEDLLRAYPEIQLEDNTALERMERIKDTAFAQRMRERLLPSSEVLVARLTEMSRERAQVQAQLELYRALVGQLQVKLREFGDAPPPQAATRLLAWLTHGLEAGPQGEKPQPLLVQDNFLRIMTAHVQVKPSGREFFVDGNDSLLEPRCVAGCRSTTAAASAAAANARPGSCRARCGKRAIMTTPSRQPRKMRALR